MNMKSKTEKTRNELGAVQLAYNTTKEKNDLVNMLVNCTGQESMYRIAEGFRQNPEIARDIMLGKLKVITFCSGLTLSTGEQIPSYTINGIEIEDQVEVWNDIHHMADCKENFVIFHVQMLTTGIDLPSLNSIVILGDKNETDLFQTIMRGCRVDYNNPEKKDYDVFIFVDGETKAYMQKFINTLDTIGGPELIAAFSNDVLQGEATHDADSLFTELLQGRAGYNAVIEEYQQIINCSGYHTKAAVMEAIQLKLMEYLDAGKMDEYQILRAKMMTENYK